MPGYTLNLWIDKQSAEEICKKEGYSVISARGIMKDLGYDIKNLKTIYKFSNRVLSELFAYLPETKSELYYSIRCIVESIIFEVDQIKECQQPSFRYISSNSVYIWRYNGKVKVNDFRCYTISCRILRNQLRKEIGKLIVYKENEPGRTINTF